MPAPPLFRSAEGEARYIAAYNAVLQDWPVPYEERHVATRLGATHVVVSGPLEAPPIILLPSLAASAVFWQPNVAALSEHFRVYAVDVIGQVGKSVPTQRIRGRRDMADWLSDLLDALHIERASLVGASYGGFLALNQASLRPERVARVVLISPAATFVRLSWKFLYTMRIKGPLRRLLRGRKAPPPKALPGGMQLAPTSWGRLMAVTMTASAPPNLAKAIVFNKRELKAIAAPVLLLIGDQETLYKPQETLDLASARLQRLTGAIIPHAGHLASVMQPAEVNRHIIEFLSPG